MITFRAIGPLIVVPSEGPRGRLIDEAAAARFWAANPTLKRRVGCYVFGVRAGKGYVPLYVGKAAVGFEQEVFADHKLKHYNASLLPRQRGTAVLFLVAKDSGGRSGLDSCLRHIEHYLIQLAAEKNPKLSNIRRQEYRILGVFRRGEWPLSPGAKELRRMLGL